jgi:hypothetical protein
VKRIPFLIAVLVGYLVTASSLSQAHAAAGGHSVGNGGGVICINGKCQTLMEAGLQVSPEYNGVWLPEANHYKLVEMRVKKGLHLTRSLVDQIYYNTFAKTDHFRKVDVVDPTKLELIKQQYLEIANASGFPLDPATFEVVAFSSDNTVKPAMTYLLPRFFELDTQQQAEILIHEGLYRGRPTSDLKFVLQLESSMAELLVQENACVIKRGTELKTCINQQIIAYRLNLLEKSELIGYVLALVYGQMTTGQNNKAGRVWLDIFGTVKVTDQTAEWTIDMTKLVRAAQYEPRLPYMFSKVKVVKFKFVDKVDLYKNDFPNNYIEVDWTKGSPVQLYSSCVDSFGLYPRTCQQFELSNPGSLQLLLPE